MLYTVVPIEDVLAGEASASLLGEVEVDGRRLVVDLEGVAEGRAPRVVRLLSTDPMDYLDARFQPGAPLAWPGCSACAPSGRVGGCGRGTGATPAWPSDRVL